MQALYAAGSGDQAAGLRRLCGRLPRQVVSVVAAQRGVGRTRLVLGTAEALAEFGRRVLVIDENASLGNINDRLKLGLRYDLRNALAGDCALDDVIRMPHPRLAVLPAARAAPGSAAAAQAGYGGLLARAAADADIVLVDAGEGGGALPYPIEGDSRHLVVLTTGPEAVTAAYGLLKRVLDGVPETCTSAAVTGARDVEQAAAIHANLAAVARRYLAAPLSYAGSYGAASGGRGRSRTAPGYGELATHVLSAPRHELPRTPRRLGAYAGSAV